MHISPQSGHSYRNNPAISHQPQKTRIQGFKGSSGSLGIFFKTTEARGQGVKGGRFSQSPQRTLSYSIFIRTGERFVLIKQLTLRVKLLGNNVTETPSIHSHTQHHCNSQQKLHGCPIEPFGHDRKTKERQGLEVPLNIREAKDSRIQGVKGSSGER